MAVSVEMADEREALVKYRDDAANLSARLKEAELMRLNALQIQVTE